MTDTTKNLIVVTTGIVALASSLVWGIAWYNLQSNRLLLENGYVEAYVPSTMQFTKVWVKTNNLKTATLTLPEAR